MPPHPREPLWFRLDGFSMNSFIRFTDTTGNRSQKLLREIFEAGGTRPPDMVCPVSLNSGLEGPGFELRSTFLLLPAPLLSPTPPVPPSITGVRSICLCPCCSRDVPFLCTAHLTISVWSTLSAIGEEKNETPSQAEIIKEKQGVYVRP